MSVQTINLPVQTSQIARPSELVKQDLNKAKLSSTGKAEPGNNKDLHAAPQQSSGGAGSPPPFDPNDMPKELKELVDSGRYMSYDYHNVDNEKSSVMLANYLLHTVKHGYLGTIQKPLDENTFSIILNFADLQDLDFSNVVFEDGFDFRTLGNPDHKNHALNFSGARLRGARFPNDLSGSFNFKGADLERANFAQVGSERKSDLNINFSEAKLRFSKLSKVNFTNANFNNADLYGTTLTEVNFEGASFKGADLGFSNLSKTSFKNCSFIDTSFKRAFLDLTLLDGSDLEGANFENAYIRNREYQKVAIFDSVINLDKVESFEGLRHRGLILPESITENYKIRKAGNKDYSNLNLAFEFFYYRILDGADFSGSYLKGASFDGCNLKNAKFRNSTLIDTLFSYVSPSDLESAQFKNSSLINIIFDNISISGAQFENCLLLNTIFDGCYLSDTSFKDSKIIDCEFEQTEISSNPTTFTRVGFANSDYLTMSHDAVDCHELTSKDLSGSNLRFCTIDELTQGLHNDLSREQSECFKPFDFSGSDLSNAFMVGKNAFPWVSLAKTKFDGADLTEANFDNAELQGSSFVKTLMNNTQINRADCKGANFNNVQILGNTNLNGTDITDATNAPKALYYKGAVGIAKNPNFKLETLQELERSNRANYQ